MWLTVWGFLKGISPGLVSSFMGTLFGALLAFFIKRAQDKREEEKKHINQGNMALFAIKLQIDTLLQYESILNEWRTKEARAHAWMGIKSILEPTEKPVINLDELGWLLESSDPNILTDIMIARNGYLTAISVNEHRAKIKKGVDEHIEREMQKEMPNFNDKFIPSEFLEKVLTPKEIGELKQSAEFMLDHTLDALHSNLETIGKLNKILKEMWPKSRFITIDKEASIKAFGIELPHRGRCFAAPRTQKVLSSAFIEQKLTSYHYNSSVVLTVLKKVWGGEEAGR